MNQKFRAIIKDIGTLYFDFESLVRHPHPIFIIRLHVLPWLRLGNQPDRFTGILDLVGKEIYENDIVAFNYFDSALADYKNIGQVIVPEECLGLVLRRKGALFVPMVDGHYNFEVLGNVHESPELLENKYETN